MKRSSLSYFIFALAVVIAIAALLMWVNRSREIQEREKKVEPVGQSTPGGATSAIPTGGQADPANQDPVDPDPGLDPVDPLRYGKSPDALMREMTKALNALDMDQFDRLSGGSIDPKSLEALRRFAAQQKGSGRALKLRDVGETGVNETYRWAIESGEDGKRVYLDIKKGPKGWTVERVTIPDANSTEPAGDDALATAEAFLLAVLDQKFEVARNYVDGGKVSDARIAGLCILFEEGKYQLRKQRPLRALLQRDGIAAYLATVVASDGSEAAQFGLNLTQTGDPAKWLVTEVNLDRLLADYAQRVAGGDVYYSPLVRNPGGGDTLALYFGFDEDEINPRTQRQLEIVAGILKSDPGKKMTLSGHTDSKGTDGYNQELSQRRAVVVKQFLLDAGVEIAQILTTAKGASQPRRPNVTESGADNPDGRRANRRTEIYLDF